MDQNEDRRSGSDPWDEDSLKLVRTLPQRQGFLWSTLPAVKILGAPFIFLGGIGLTQQLMPVINRGPEYEYAVAHMGAWFLVLLLALVLLGIGSALWFGAEYYMFEKAPLGDLAKALFEGVARGKINKVRTIAASIARTADGKTETADSLPLFKNAARQDGHEPHGDPDLAATFITGAAYEILAEISASEEEAGRNAQKAVSFLASARAAGVNTPLLLFLLANALRIVKNHPEAIEVYRAYLEKRPADETALRNLRDLTAGAGGV